VVVGVAVCQLSLSSDVFEVANGREGPAVGDWAFGEDVAVDTLKLSDDFAIFFLRDIHSAHFSTYLFYILPLPTNPSLVLSNQMHSYMLLPDSPPATTLKSHS
jgi:hypothetical protein